LSVTALDLKSGTTATFAHGLAAAYIGFTVAFGSTVIAWADGHFAHRFAAGPAPRASPARGWKAVRFELALWARCIVACVIAVALLEVMIAFVANDAVTQPLYVWYKHAFGCILFWFILGPAWSLASAGRGSQ
jgi:sterol desaturase/sphingolipid hydroxylase (fatty acid hydroxylase superfamily)